MAKFFQFPDRAAWAQTAIALIVFAALAAAFGTLTGLFEFELSTDLAAVLQVAVIALLLPAFLEELVFRAPLIWLADKCPDWLSFWVCVSLALFVAWHPVNGFFLMTEARDTFTDWRFLALASTLGVVATWLALKTRSIWPTVVFHWLCVVGWKAFLGGPTFL